MAAPPPATGEVPVKLGFDTYSLRAFNWKAPQLLSYAANLKLDTIQISSLGDYESLDPAYLQKVKDQADRLHIQVDGGTGCICPSSTRSRAGGPFFANAWLVGQMHPVPPSIWMCSRSA